ncbi:MAG: nuclear transport factor 2 family protein [Dehalococcoidia bacterium]|nr:nuclear transport factor 2 family protein [Dehalococcoidia bacterium]
MSRNLDAVNALITAINFDRFAEIEAWHAPDVLFTSFRGPILHDSVAVADWQRTFLREYADCSYGELEYVEEGDTVVVRATIEAKGYDWRPFTQRVVEVFRMADEAVAERRLYGMLRDTELDKPTAAALEHAVGFRGGDAVETQKRVCEGFTALLTGDVEAARESFAEKAVLIDGVYGLANGFDNLAALFLAIPRPAFGQAHVRELFAAEHTALVEVAIAPERPRAAYWLRLVDGKIAVVEGYWMLREIGVPANVAYDRDRHQRQVILPT